MMLRAVNHVFHSRVKATESGAVQDLVTNTTVGRLAEELADDVAGKHDTVRSLLFSRHKKNLFYNYILKIFVLVYTNARDLNLSYCRHVTFDALWAFISHILGSLKTIAVGCNPMTLANIDSTPTLSPPTSSSACGASVSSGLYSAGWVLPRPPQRRHYWPGFRRLDK